MRACHRVTETAACRSNWPQSKPATTWRLNAFGSGPTRACRGAFCWAGMADELTAIARNPEWLPHTYDASGSTLTLFKVSREAHRQLPFLSTEELRKGYETAAVPAEPLANLVAAEEPAPLHFIFHTAFCCSTLLVNALDATDRAVGMKEPAIFLNLVHRLGRGEDFDSSNRLDLALRLLARPFEGSTATIAKPSCFANPLAAHALAAMPHSRAVLLYSDLHTFLLAVAKRGIAGRAWSREIFAGCMKFIPIELGQDPTETAQVTDLHLAGLAWLMRRNHFDRISAQFGSDRGMQLDANQLLANGAETVRTVCDFYGLNVDSSTISEVAEGPIFRRHSKEANRPYGPEERARERNRLWSIHGEEIERVATWVERVARRLTTREA